MSLTSSLYFAGLVLFSCSYGFSQVQQISSLPDSPDAHVTLVNDMHSGSTDYSYSNEPVASLQSNIPPAPTSEQIPQTKRILGIIPNFRAVSANQKLPPQSVKEKFITATEDSFDYSALVLPAVLAGYSMATKATPEFHQGAAGYGRYFWHSYADQSIENYAVEFVVPALTHEDFMFFSLGLGGFF
jgi:hypothetical protein